MPTALCSPILSFRCGIKATVTSPGSPPSTVGFTGILTMLSPFEGLQSSHFGIVCTFSFSKYFQLRIVRADVGSARMMVLVPVAGSWRRVASLQWSGMCCDMTTRSGSGRSVNDAIHA